MLELKDAYYESDQLDFTNVGFQCEYCAQHYNHFTVNLSVFLYGIFSLIGKDEAFTGFTCPSCLKTVFLHCNDPSKIQSIKHRLIGFSGFGGPFPRPDPQYYSSLLYI